MVVYDASIIRPDAARGNPTNVVLQMLVAAWPSALRDLTDTSNWYSFATTRNYPRTLRKDCATIFKSYRGRAQRTITCAVGAKLKGIDLGRSIQESFSRRRFLSSAVAIAAPQLMSVTSSAAAERPPEITTIRLEDFPAICLVPAFLAEELLYAEGFTRVEYVKTVVNELAETDDFDLTLITAPAVVKSQDASPRWTAIAGIHSGCQELFGNARVRTIRDLKGKSVAISSIGSGEHVFVASVAAYVGIDPNRDIDWIIADSSENAFQRFVDGKADAYLAFEPHPYLLKERKIGHVILNTTEDKPWSQYFCCMAVARKEFIRRYPIATKRALRAILKAIEICSREPERVAKYLADKGHEPRYKVSLDVIKSLPFDRWRKANPEDTLRFHALRLHEVGMIKTSPNKLIARGTDWRFLNELKRELKA